MKMYDASKDLIRIINQDACENDMPIAICLLPWCVIAETVCLCTGWIKNHLLRMGRGTG